MNKQDKTYDDKTAKRLAAIMQERIKGTFCDFLGMNVIKYQEGYCLTKSMIKPEFLNPLGSIHGGYLFTIADTTAGMASIIPGSDSTVTTIDGNMQFLNAVLNCDGLYAEAKGLKSGKRVVYTDVVIKGEEGTLFAKGSYTFARITLPHVAAPVMEER